MGLFYRTLFVPNIKNLEKHIVLSKIDPIIDDQDKKQGYIDKKQLIKYFGQHICEKDIIEESYIVEMMKTSLDKEQKEVETQRLPIK